MTIRIIGYFRRRRRFGFGNPFARFDYVDAGYFDSNAV